MTAQRIYEGLYMPYYEFFKYIDKIRHNGDISATWDRTHLLSLKRQ